MQKTTYVPLSWRTTGKTPNGTPWPLTHETHSQDQINYAFRSPGSWLPESVAYGNATLQRNLDRVAAEQNLTGPREILQALIAERGHIPGDLHERK